MSDPSEATEPPAADTEESKPPADPPATAEPDAQPKAAETGASNASKGNKNGKRSGKGKTGQGRGNKSPQRSPLGTDPAQRKAEKQEHLQASVIKNGDRLSELLVEMDADKDGKVEKREWRRGLAAGHIDATQQEMDALFDALDPTSSGLVAYKDLSKQVDAEKEGSSAAVAATDFPLRTETSEWKRKVKEAAERAAEGGTASEAVGGVSLLGLSTSAKRLFEALCMSRVKAAELFKEWDEDGSGKISKKEFRQALPALGLHASKEDADAVFNLVDPSAGGVVETAELSATLKRHAARLKTLQSKQPPKRLGKAVQARISALNHSYTGAAIAPPQLMQTGQARSRAMPCWDASTPVGFSPLEAFAGQQQEYTRGRVGGAERKKHAASPPKANPAESGGLFLTSMGATDEARTPTKRVPKPPPKQLPAISPNGPGSKGVSFPRGKRSMGLPQMNTPGPAQYDSDAPAQRRAKGAPVFAGKPPPPGVSPAVMQLVKQQNEKITTALSRLDDLEQRIMALAKEQG